MKTNHQLRVFVVITNDKDVSEKPILEFCQGLRDLADYHERQYRDALTEQEVANHNAGAGDMKDPPDEMPAKRGSTETNLPYEQGRVLTSWEYGPYV